jgi:hypothetical protein
MVKNKITDTLKGCGIARTELAESHFFWDIFAKMGCSPSSQPLAGEQIIYL